MERGLIDARLGGGVYKKRIALSGRGKRSSACTLLAANLSDRWIFIAGYTKGDMSSLDVSTVAALKRLAAVLLSKSEPDLGQMVLDGVLLEIPHAKRED